MLPAHNQFLSPGSPPGVKEGWEKRAVIGAGGIHILYTQAEGSLEPNKHVDGRVCGDVIIAKVAAERRKVGPPGWEYEDVDPNWLDKELMRIRLNLFVGISSQLAHGFPQNR